MALFLRFRSQLRRTRPELVSRLEAAAVQAVSSAGGKITGERRLISASFDDTTFGFWLDMLLLVETVVKTIEAESACLYGYSLVLGKDLPAAFDLPQALEAFCRFLTGADRRGVFLDRTVREGLLPYVAAEEPEKWAAGRLPPTAGAQNYAGNFFRLTEIKSFSPAVQADIPLLETIAKTLTREQCRSVLITGPFSEGQREAVYRYCASLIGGFPPLFIRFGGGGINALTDAWPAQVQSLAVLKDEEEIVGEISYLWDFLFRERLREELSPYIIRKARCFYRLLLAFYINAARRNGTPPVLVIENIHLAEQKAAEIVIEAHADIQEHGPFVLGLCDKIPADGDLRQWEPVFFRQISSGADGVLRQPSLPLDLWEIAYAFSLFGRYFPPDFLPVLFAEEGKNSAMIFRAMDILSAMGVIDTSRDGPVAGYVDPRPRAGNFAGHAAAVLGKRAQWVRAMLCRRLLSWVERKKIQPCFRLLVILADLGGMENIDDQLMLKFITSDLVNGTALGIQQAWNTGVLETIAGSDRIAALRYIIKTTWALLSGTEHEIRTAFAGTPPECSASPVLQAQILVNIAACYLGQRNNAAALENVKEAVLMSQKQKRLCLAQSYRLLSLESISMQKTGEAIDYLGFALDNAEKFGNYHEMGLSAYYAATAQFLYGNISRAVQFAQSARSHALAAGCPEWADRARFLEGRLAFELGSYQAALEIFENLRRAPDGEPLPEKDRLFAAWTYRSQVYCRKTPVLKPVEGGSEAGLFEVEAAYFAGNYRQAVEFADSLVNIHSKDNFIYTEQPDWRSTFAQCEYLHFPAGEIWGRMLYTYRSLSACHGSGSGEIPGQMRRILRDGQLSDMDPWDAFYFYAWYCVLEQTGASQVDMGTILSMAFKRLQHRASRIDDIETRRQFLSQPYWNNALMQAAKKFKPV